MKDVNLRMLMDAAGKEKANGSTHRLASESFRVRQCGGDDPDA